MALRTLRRPFSDARVRRSVFRILEEAPLCSMATLTKAGRVHVNTAYFAYTRGLTLYFLSDPDSIHCRNVASHPSMAMTVFRSDRSWGGSDRGLQLFGTCGETAGRSAAVAARVYGRRFPLYARWTSGTSPRERRLAAQLRTYRFYRFSVVRLKILDEREFGGAVLVEVRVPRRPRSRG